MDTHTISIGFAISGTGDTLPPQARKAFAEQVHHSVDLAGLHVVFVGAGVGFDPTTGQGEPSCTLVAVGDLEPLGRNLLEGQLAALAVAYGQSSIAFTTGATVLVEPATTLERG